MGFDDFFDHDHKHKRHGYNHYLEHDDHYRGYHQQSDLKYQLLNKLKTNPKLKAVILFAAVVLIIILVVVTILLIPLIMKLFNFLTQNGIQGVLDAVWKGTK